MELTVQKKNRIRFPADKVFMLLLALFPFRHVAWGVDLADVGYNYANYRYMGTDHMDSMWLFSTWLSNLVGHFFTLLPGGHTLLGMNIYTGLFAAATGLIAYYFCTRVLKISAVATFAGEMAALCLCWCPTALLYNYMTYLFVLLCMICLYLGLTEEKKKYLILAGLLLGSNIFVRFSNLAEAAYILIVWVYDFLTFREKKKSAEEYPLLQNLLKHTGLCLLGYLLGAGIWMLVIAVIYGPVQYVNGIRRLFSMTEGAEDYKASSMIKGMIKVYLTNLYWVGKLVVSAAEGVAICLFALWSEKWEKRKRIVLTAILSVLVTALYFSGRFSFAFFWITGEGIGPKICLTAGVLAFFLSVIVGKQKAVAHYLVIAVSVLTVAWLYPHGFTSFKFYSYDSMILPATLLMIFAMLTAAIRFFTPGVRREEKLLGTMVVLLILITAIGSNNGIYPSINNLFLVIPYLLAETGTLIAYVTKNEGKWQGAALYPFLIGLTVFLSMCAVQFGGFGKNFSFCEGTGLRDLSTKTENNSTLKNITMSEERAGWLSELTEYVKRENLTGQEVILMGSIPSLSFYLELPSAFNPWSDLDSYSTSEFESAVNGLGGEKPLIIVEKSLGDYMLSRLKLQTDETFPETLLRKHKSVAPKTEILLDFMQKSGYEMTFENEKFMLFR